MFDQTMIATVTAATAAGTAEGLTAVGRAALARLTRLLRDTFGADTQAAATLGNAQADPSNRERLRDLHTVMADAMTDTPAIADDVHLLWHHLQRAQVSAAGGGVANSIPGTVHGPVVQARDVHGGISFGYTRTAHRDSGA